MNADSLTTRLIYAFSAEDNYFIPFFTQRTFVSVNSDICNLVGIIAYNTDAIFHFYWFYSISFIVFFLFCFFTVGFFKVL